MSRRSDRIDAIIERELADVEGYKGGAGQDLVRLWRVYLNRHHAHVVGATILVALGVIVTYGFPLTARYLIDEVLAGIRNLSAQAFARRYRGLLLVFGLNCGIWTVKVITEWLSRRLLVTSGQQLVYGLRRDLHEKLQQLHVGFYERIPPGRLLSRVLDDVNIIQEWSTMRLVMLFSCLVTIAFGGVLMVWLHWRMALIVFLALPFYAVAYRVFKPRIRRAHIAMRRLNSKLYGLAAERVRGVAVVKAFTAEKRELRRFASLIFDHVRVGMRVVTYTHGLAFLAMTISAVALGVVIYILFLQVKAGPAAGGITLGSAIAFIDVSRRLFNPVAQLASMLTMIQAVFVVIRRVLRILDTRVDVVPGSIQLAGMKGKISFDHVTFTYPDQSAPALRAIDFHIHAGEKVALMGPSGAGKSTIFQLLMRFYDPQQGTVRVGGVNLVDADPGSVRRHVRMVQQEPVIFSGTVADNIAYGDFDARPVEIMRAAEAAELHSFIMDQPVKYETLIGENGVTLSGGQKQRLALATALLTDPEILLLDDTTSALDTKTEARIRATLNKVLEGRTSFIITQRIATARDCDRIIVMEEGRITQMGTHEELSQQPGFYQRICEQQEAV